MVPIVNDSQLEKTTHYVVDITGNMQKRAKTDTLWLSAEVHKQLKDKSGFVLTEEKVDGHQVLQWSPRLMVPEEPVGGLVLQTRPGDPDAALF